MMRTIGLSPKLYAAVAAAVLGYLATQTLVTMPGWAALLIQVGLVAAGVFAAGPGRVVSRAAGVRITGHSPNVTIGRHSPNVTVDTPHSHRKAEKK